LGEGEDSAAIPEGKMTPENDCMPDVSGTQKARRSGRLSLEIPILIIGTDHEGRVFSEHTHTVVVSLHGAGIVSKHKLMAEQDLVVRAIDSDREAEVRVVGEIGQQGKMHTYGVRFVDQRLDFWKMEFPSMQPHEPSGAMMALECSACKNVVELHGGDFEYEICAIHGGMARYCDDCGFLTIWRQSQDYWRIGKRVVAERRSEISVETRLTVVKKKKGVKEESEVVEDFLPLAEAISKPDRRKRVRAKVNFAAFVKSDQPCGEVVTCIDMSRGGVSFRSKKVYEKETTVQIAVPFSPETKDDQVIFVPGRITNVSEIAGGGIWRCGLEFLRR
jgi:hypothetical protein